MWEAEKAPPGGALSGSGARPWGEQVWVLAPLSSVHLETVHSGALASAAEFKSPLPAFSVQSEAGASTFLSLSFSMYVTHV